MRLWTKSKPKFTLVENPGVAHYAIRVDQKPYAGVVYSYDRVKVWENTGETATLKFDYTVHVTPDGVSIDDDFENLVGDILVQLLEENDVR